MELRICLEKLQIVDANCFEAQNKITNNLKINEKLKHQVRFAKNSDLIISNSLHEEDSEIMDGTLTDYEKIKNEKLGVTDDPPAEISNIDSGIASDSSVLSPSQAKKFKLRHRFSTQRKYLTRASNEFASLTETEEKFSESKYESSTSTLKLDENVRGKYLNENAQDKSGKKCTNKKLQKCTHEDELVVNERHINRKRKRSRKRKSSKATKCSRSKSKSLSKPTGEENKVKQLNRIPNTTSLVDIKNENKASVCKLDAEKLNFEQTEAKNCRNNLTANLNPHVLLERLSYEKILNKINEIKNNVSSSLGNNKVPFINHNKKGKHRTPVNHQKNTLFENNLIKKSENVKNRRIVVNSEIIFPEKEQEKQPLLVNNIKEQKYNYSNDKTVNNIKVSNINNIKEQKYNYSNDKTVNVIKRSILKRDYNYNNVIPIKRIKRPFRFNYIPEISKIHKLTSGNDVFEGTQLSDGFINEDFCLTYRHPENTVLIQETKHTILKNRLLGELSVPVNKSCQDDVINNSKVKYIPDPKISDIKEAKVDISSKPIFAVPSSNFITKFKQKHIFKFPEKIATKRPPTRTNQQHKLNKARQSNITHADVSKLNRPAGRNVYLPVKKSAAVDFDAISLYAESITHTPENTTHDFNDDIETDYEFEDYLKDLVANDNDLQSSNTCRIDVSKWVEYVVSDRQEIHFETSEQVDSGNVTSVLNKQEKDVLENMTDKIDTLKDTQKEAISVEQNNENEVTKTRTVSQSPVCLTNPQIKECQGNVIVASRSSVNEQPVEQDTLSVHDSEPNLLTSFDKELSVTNEKECTPQNATSQDIFYNVCSGIKSSNECKKAICPYDHIFPPDWENMVLNLPIDNLNNYYKSVKNEKYFYLFKKIFPIMTKQLGTQKDFNHLVILVQDILTMNINSDRTPFIENIIKEVCNIGITFHSAVEIIFKSACLDNSLGDLLCDILLYIAVENGDLEENWSVVQMLLQHKKHNVDKSIMQNILKETSKDDVKPDLCRKVYNDLILLISNNSLSNISPNILRQYITSLRKIGLTRESISLHARCSSLNMLEARVYHNYSPSSSNTTVESQNVGTSFPNYRHFSARKSVTPTLYQQASYRNESQSHTSATTQVAFNRSLSSGMRTLSWPNNQRKSLPANSAHDTSTGPSNHSVSLLKLDINKAYPSETEIRQAIHAESVPTLMSFVEKFQDNDNVDNFLGCCINALQKTAHNFPTFFYNLCSNAVVLGDLHKKSAQMKVFLKTVGINLVLYLAQQNKWDPAYLIFQKLNDMFGEDFSYVKIFLHEKYSVNRRLLIFSEIYLQKKKFQQAWNILRENMIQRIRFQNQNWDNTDLLYEKKLLFALMSELCSSKNWIAGLDIVTYFMKYNIKIIDITVYADIFVCIAINMNCHVSSIFNFINNIKDWYNYVKEPTFRAILVYLCRRADLNTCIYLYQKGCELSYYPFVSGQENVLEISTHYVAEEIFLMFETLFRNMLKFFPRQYCLVIKIRETISSSLSMESNNYPKCLYQNNITSDTMRIRIANVLINKIQPRMLFTCNRNTIVIEPAQITNHLLQRKSKFHL